MNANQLLEQFSHNSKWWWLRLRLNEEYPTEPVRRAIRDRQSRGLRLQPELADLMLPGRRKANA